LTRFDKDGSGVIDRQEFIALHEELVKQQITAKSLQGALEAMDANRDGKIMFAEYARYMLQHS
jgi:Ca2+-binding EF-hand superfamily protein